MARLSWTVGVRSLAYRVDLYKDTDPICQTVGRGKRVKNSALQVIGDLPTVIAEVSRGL